MKLLSKETYKKIEKILYDAHETTDPKVTKALEALNNFFKGSEHEEFLNTYYYNRHKYNNRCPKNSMLFKKICNQLYIEEPTLYIIKKEVIYKAAMIFYKNGVI